MLLVGPALGERLTGLGATAKRAGTAPTAVEMARRSGALAVVPKSAYWFLAGTRRGADLTARSWGSHGAPGLPFGQHRWSVHRIRGRVVP